MTTKVNLFGVLHAALVQSLSNFIMVSVVTTKVNLFGLSILSLFNPTCKLVIKFLTVVYVQKISEYIFFV